MKETTIAVPLVRDRCRRPRCQREATCRGLCRTDYQIANQLVLLGATTWKELERLGRCEPAQRTAKDWFLAK
jgi:hypothetical protein